MALQIIKTKHLATHEIAVLPRTLGHNNTPISCIKVGDHPGFTFVHVEGGHLTHDKHQWGLMSAAFAEKIREIEGHIASVLFTNRTKLFDASFEEFSLETFVEGCKSVLTPDTNNVNIEIAPNFVVTDPFGNKLQIGDIEPCETIASAYVCISGVQFFLGSWQLTLTLHQAITSPKETFDVTKDAFIAPVVANALPPPNKETGAEPVPAADLSDAEVVEVLQTENGEVQTIPVPPTPNYVEHAMAPPDFSI